MSKKRIVALLATVAVVAGLFAGCANKNSTTKESNPAPSTGTENQKTIKVGLVTDTGGINDKSFNQSADTGIQKAKKEGGVDYKYIESQKEQDYAPNLQSLVEDFNADLTFGVGFKMQKDMGDVAKKYPDKKFALIDEEVKASNVVSIKFKEEEGSFLMGVIAGKMTKTGKVGFIGGIDMPLIQKFEAGFAAGVKAVNPEAAKGLVTPDGKRGTMVRYAGDFNKPDVGNEAAKFLYNAGCDIIFHASGATGTGLFQAASELKKAGKDVWAIGVDMDQAVTLPEYADIILSSMVKRVDVGTYDTVKDVINGSFKGGQTITLGLKEDGVGVADTSKNHVPADILTLVNKYSDKIKAGDISVPAEPAKVAGFTAPEVK